MERGSAGAVHREFWRVVAGLIAGVALLLAATVGAAQAKPHAAKANGCLPGQPVGAPGIGDAYYPTYGNGGYDVRRYELDVNYNPATQLIDRGKATIAARATQSVCRFNLDFVGFDIERLEVDGERAKWSRDEHELTITPRHALERGRPFEVFVRYSGEPTEFVIPGLDLRTGFMDTADGATVAGQPEVAAGWFPVNDHPRDKAAYAFDVKVPDGYEVVANGFLRDVDTGGRRTTWRWVAPEPMASYLATIDIGFWDVSTGRTAQGLPFYDAVDSALTGGLRDEIDSSLAKQSEILDLLGAAFGPYPFRTVGGIVEGQDDLRFALETQTRAVYSKLFWLDSEGNPENGDSVVVHELAHQWYGDDVAVHRWKDIWLNEGFATYAEWLWAEHVGEGTPQEIFEATYNAIPADDEFWTLVIADPGVERLFDDPVYVRGAMTLQALRNEVGDSTFFQIAQQWASTQSGGTGTTEEFIALAEEIAGRDLDSVWDPWLFSAGKPPLTGAAPARARSLDAAGTDWRAVVDDRLNRIGSY
jgi:aminopeptidase N